MEQVLENKPKQSTLRMKQTVSEIETKTISETVSEILTKTASETVSAIKTKTEILD